MLDIIYRNMKRYQIFSKCLTFYANYAIEHIEPMRIPAFERSVFEFAAPKTVILTTPNREYNANYEKMQENQLRHGDHRFEWTRAEFRAWTEHDRSMADRYRNDTLATARKGSAGSAAWNSVGE